MKSSRTSNSIRNSSWALVSQVIDILLNFVSRTIFIQILGVEYLGINGLFTNVLMLLSFAELGIGQAIIYSMYKPLAVNDEEKIKSLMALYSKAYKAIGSFVFVAGLAVIPFMEYIIKDAPNITENIILIYCLFLVNAALSYFFVYKHSIIMADQKNYLIVLYRQAFRIIQIILQIIFLIVTGEYIAFLLIQILFTFLNNAYMAKKTDKMYPFLKVGKAKPLERSESQGIFKNIRAMFLYKFGSVVLNGTDNIMISALIGVGAVGLTSNYLLILTAVTTMAGQIMNGFTASIGNLNAVSDTNSKERVFNRIFFLSVWMYGFLSIGLFLYLNPLIDLWLGEEFVLSQSVVFALVLHFYINSVHFTAYTYRTTMGLFVKGRMAPVLAAVVNIVLSLWLGKKYGLVGIFLATSIARFFTTGIVDPVLIYKHGFKKNPIHYYRRYFGLSGICILVGGLVAYIVQWINVGNVLGFVLAVGLVTLLFNSFMIAIFWRTDDFQDIKTRILRMFSTRDSVKKI